SRMQVRRIVTGAALDLGSRWRTRLEQSHAGLGQTRPQPELLLQIDVSGALYSRLVKTGRCCEKRFYRGTRLWMQPPFQEGGAGRTGQRQASTLLACLKMSSIEG